MECKSLNLALKNYDKENELIDTLWNVNQYRTLDNLTSRTN